MACSDFAILQSPPPSPSPPLPVAAKVSRPPRRRRSPSPSRSVALPVAAAPHPSRRQGQLPSPSPALPVAAKVSRPPHCRSSPSPSQGHCSTTFFSKTREISFLTRCRSRQRGLYADGAPHKGLRAVDEARSRGLHASKVAGSHPDNFGFWRKMLYILEKNVVYFGEKCCIFRLGLAQP